MCGDASGKYAGDAGTRRKAVRITHPHQRGGGDRLSSLCLGARSGMRPWSLSTPYPVRHGVPYAAPRPASQCLPYYQCSGKPGGKPGAMPGPAMRTDKGDARSLRHMRCGTHRHAHGWKRLHDVCEGMATAAGTVPAFWSHFVTSLCVTVCHCVSPFVTMQTALTCYTCYVRGVTNRCTV